MTEKEPSLPAQEPENIGSTESVDTRVEWLKQHASPIESLDLDNEDFSDLEPFGEAIGDARIVMLGEASHADGATFEAKSRLVKYLHQERGFEVLAMESGIYDCRKAWEGLKRGDDPPTAFRSGVFAVWSKSKEIQPLVQYMADNAHSDHPLELAGFDLQFSGAENSKQLKEDFALLRDKLGNDVIDGGQSADIENALIGLAKTCQHPDRASDVELNKWKDATEKLQTILDKAQPSHELSEAELDHWRQISVGATVLADVIANDKKGNDDGHAKAWELRDKQMADNLVRLSQKVYPGKKIIVWAASAHILRNFPEVEAMGDHVYRKLGDQIYTVGFTAAEGETRSAIRGESKPIDPPRPGSLEDLFVKAGHENAFVDFRHLGPDGAWLKKELEARPFGYYYHKKQWTKVFDGMVFMKTMHGATKYEDDK